MLFADNAKLDERTITTYEPKNRATKSRAMTNQATNLTLSVLAPLQASPQRTIPDPVSDLLTRSHNRGKQSWQSPAADFYLLSLHPSRCRQPIAYRRAHRPSCVRCPRCSRLVAVVGFGVFVAEFGGCFVVLWEYGHVEFGRGY